MSNDHIRNAMDRFAAAVADVKRAQRHGGLNWSKIARDHGVTMTTLRRHCDPDFHDRDNERRAVAKRARQPKRETTYLRVCDKKPKREDYSARLAEIPEDDRSLSARIFGDPIFSRSALGREIANKKAGNNG